VSGIEFGLAFQGDKSAEEHAALARLAEGLGFDTLSVYGDLLYQPPLYPLLVMALATRSIRLGPACLNPFTQHPLELAGQAAALDAASGGRAFLGITRGSWLDRLGLAPPRPLAGLGDALEIVRRLLAGDARGYAGEVFSLEPGTALAYPRERRGVPLMVGTWSRGAARIAARLADEVKVGGSANPAMVRRMRRWLAEDLPRYRRGEDEVGVVVGALTVADRDGAAARCRARREVAMYLEVVGTLDPTARLPAGLLPGLRQLLRASKVEAAGRLVPDDILDLFAFAGTPEQISRQVEVLAEAGVRRIEFGTPHGAPAEAGIRLLAAQVLPHFR
jgi:5,10-methylenetetrahydromethanopterin reductase